MRKKTFVIVALVIASLLSAYMGYFTPLESHAAQCVCDGHHDGYVELPKGGSISSGKYFVKDDMRLEKPITIEDGSEVVICLNGHILVAAYEDESVFLCGQNVNVTLTSCDTTTQHEINTANAFYSFDCFATGFQGAGICGANKAVFVEKNEVGISTLVVENVTFMGNSTKEIGCCINVGWDANVGIYNCAFISNTVTNYCEEDPELYGGIVSICDQLVLEKCLFAKNTVEGLDVYGGLVFSDSLIATGNVFVNNTVAGSNYIRGGLIDTIAAKIEDITFEGNHIEYGEVCEGALLNACYALDLYKATLQKNSAKLVADKLPEETYFLGMICNCYDEDVAEVTYLTAKDNEVYGFNIAGVVGAFNNAAIIESTITDNTADVCLHDTDFPGYVECAGIFILYKSLYLDGYVEIEKNKVVYKEQTSNANVGFYQVEAGVVIEAGTMFDLDSCVGLMPTTPDDYNLEPFIVVYNEGTDDLRPRFVSDSDKFILESDDDLNLVFVYCGKQENPGDGFIGEESRTEESAVPREQNSEDSENSNNKETYESEIPQESSNHTDTPSFFNNTSYQWQRIYPDGTFDILQGQTGKNLDTTNLVIGTYRRIDTEQSGVVTSSRVQTVVPKVLQHPASTNDFVFKIDSAKCAENDIYVSYYWYSSKTQAATKPIGYVCKGQTLDKVPDGLYYCAAYLTQGDETFIINSSYVYYSTYSLGFSFYNSDVVDYSIDYVKPGSSVELPSLPKESDLELLGWATQPYSHSVDYKAGDSVKVEENMHLYALWVKKNNYVTNDVEEKESFHPEQDEKKKLFASSITNLNLLGWIYGEAPHIPTSDSNVDGVVYTYSNTLTGEYTPVVPTQPGIYYIKASVAETDEHTATQTIKRFEIKPGIYDMSDVEFASAVVVANGSAVSLSVSGELPVGADGVPVTVAYSLSEVTEPGVYKIVATFTGSENYDEINPMVAYLELRKPNLQVVDDAGNTVCQIEVKGGIVTGLALDVINEAPEDLGLEESEQFKILLGEDEELGQVFDVKLFYNGEEVQPSDIKEDMHIVVRFKIPEEMLGKEIRIAHVHSDDDITYIVAGDAPSVGTYVIEDGYLVTVIDRLSDFVIMYRVTAKCRVHYYLALTTVLLLAFVILCFVAKKNTLNALSIVGLLAFGLITVALSFLARCEICNILLCVNGAIILTSFLLFLYKTNKKKEESEEDDDNYNL